MNNKQLSAFKALYYCLTETHISAIDEEYGEGCFADHEGDEPQCSYCAAIAEAEEVFAELEALRGQNVT